jgi:hypothetical protein
VGHTDGVSVIAARDRLRARLGPRRHSTVGGMSAFGINGFVIGHLIAALFVSCWDISLLIDDETETRTDETPLTDPGRPTQPAAPDGSRPGR